MTFSPQGESFGWLTGPKADAECDWNNLSCVQDPDEGDYIAAIITKIRAIGGNGNIYAIGVSNGAALAYRLASNAGDALPFKGVVAVVSQMLKNPLQSGGGLYNYNQPSKGRSNQGISVLQILGTTDFVPYDGGTSIVFEGVDDFKLYPALDSMKAWADHNDCSGDHTETDIPASFEEGSPIQVSSVRKYDYSGGCPSGEILEHYRVETGHGAGDVTINGVPFMNNYPYDFIDRVEDTLRNNGGCQDSPLRFKITKNDGRKIMRDCAWVSVKAGWRCTFDGVASACSNSCGTCDDCDDSALRFKITKNDGRKIMRDCAWVSVKAGWRCTFDGVSQACRAACGTCLVSSIFTTV